MTTLLQKWTLHVDSLSSSLCQLITFNWLDCHTNRNEWSHKLLKTETLQNVPTQAFSKTTDFGGNRYTTLNSVGTTTNSVRTWSYHGVWLGILTAEFYAYSSADILASGDRNTKSNYKPFLPMVASVLLGSQVVIQQFFVRLLFFFSRCKTSRE